MMPDRAIHQLKFSMNLLKRMEHICSNLNAIPFHFLLATLRTFVFRYTDDRDMVLLMVDGNRPHIDVEELVGCFINTIPLRFQEYCAEMNFEDLITTAGRTTLQALSHSEVAFHEIVNLLDLPRNPGYMPIGQISINYQMHGAVPSYHTQDFEVTTVSMHNMPTPCEMALEVVELVTPSWICLLSTQQLSTAMTIWNGTLRTSLFS
jgi:non-ribosomal peptide synthetase component F